MAEQFFFHFGTEMGRNSKKKHPVCTSIWFHCKICRIKRLSKRLWNSIFKIKFLMISHLPPTLPSSLDKFAPNIPGHRIFCSNQDEYRLKWILWNSDLQNEVHAFEIITLPLYYQDCILSYNLLLFFLVSNGRLWSLTVNPGKWRPVSEGDDGIRARDLSL